MLRDCKQCVLFTTKLNDIGGVPVHSDFNQRQTDTKAADIENMIGREDDPKYRNILQLMQFLINQNTGLAKGIFDINNTLKRDIDAQMKRMDKLDETIEDHAKELKNHHDIVQSTKGSWQVITYVFGGLMVLGMAIGGYGYTVIDNLKLSVVEMKTSSQTQSALYPELSRELDLAKNLKTSVEEVRKISEDNKVQIEDIQDQLDALQDFTERTKRKKAWRAMK